MKALPVLLFAVATPILAGCNDASPPPQTAPSPAEAAADPEVSMTPKPDDAASPPGDSVAPPSSPPQNPPTLPRKSRRLIQ